VQTHGSDAGFGRLYWPWLRGGAMRQYQQAHGSTAMTSERRLVLCVCLITSTACSQSPASPSSANAAGERPSLRLVCATTMTETPTITSDAGFGLPGAVCLDGATLQFQGFTIATDRSLVLYPAGATLRTFSQPNMNAPVLGSRRGHPEWSDQRTGRPHRVRRVCDAERGELLSGRNDRHGGSSRCVLQPRNRPCAVR
jgi:hypothetical protein